MTDMVTGTKLSTLRSVVASETHQSSTFLDARSEQGRVSDDKMNNDLAYNRMQLRLENDHTHLEHVLGVPCCDTSGMFFAYNSEFDFLVILFPADLLCGIRREMEAGTLPKFVARLMEELYLNYRNAVFQSGDPGAEHIVLSNMSLALDRILSDVKDPFEFSPYHEAIREPFNYSLFVQNYIRPLINFRESYVGNIYLFYEMEEQLKQGENVILISNHQTEADPAIIALLLETTSPYISENARDGSWYPAKIRCSVDGGAVFQSGDPGAEHIVLSNMSLALDRILSDVKDPFEFSPYHEAIREPFNYSLFVQNYIRPLINFRESYVGNIYLFYEMEEQLKQGENVILISNHQTEADPAIIALLLETTSPYISENAINVAGDRVLTDPLCKPFSMGRWSYTYSSAKHMNDVSELAEMKRMANTRTLKEMALLLRSGSKLIWIAASGGRDRPDPITNQWFPAPFDASSVDNMRRLVEHAGVPGHIYPLALLCYDIMPPPPQVEKEIGERRVISYHGAGLSVAPKIDYNEVTASSEGPKEAKEAYSQALYDSICQQYNVLKTAVHGAQGLEASTASVSLSQPWQLLN
ncbi:glycerol-3-phosphate acyltransferase protein [Artemisia annua]|uniref:glycerol-3-phosphate 1-O-acyltransferase n=1 Tax=Artemisia annua TaxID=35608 RepID=A0A2U1QD65_ARTAN|nr:glycerol-3-phosphate acyltransferase protein [Artemisia annua]